MGGGATGGGVVLQDGEHMKNTSSNMFVNAAAATDKEHAMTLWQGIKLYPKAIMWSMLISSLCAMEGYDVSLVNAFPPFNRKYGHYTGPEHGYQVSAKWQTSLANGAQCGQILGLIVNGYFTERYGYRPVIMGCLVFLAAVTTIFFCAPSVQVLLVGEILAGIPWGVFQSIAISYASEVCPVALRGYLTTYGNICWGWGQLIGVGVIMAMFKREDQWAYRIPYGLMWMWYPPLLIGVFFAPESPWWLVRHGKLEEAKKSLSRLTSSKADSNFDLDETIDMMRHTTELEKDITSGSSYLDCFKGTDLRRTEIVCMLWATQNFSGNTFSNYSTYFFEQAGLVGTIGYKFAMGQYAINVVGTIVGWVIMSLGVGRRRLFITGLCGLCVTLLVLGFMGLIPDRKAYDRSMATGSLMLVWATWYQISVGSIAFSLVAEMSTRRLQIKTVSLGRAAYNVAAIICNTLTPRMINPEAWNWKNFAGFFWAGSCALCILYHYFRLPEPTGRTFAELDILFERKVPARKFKTTHVNAFDVAINHQVAEDKPELSHVDHVDHVEKV
ncbi:General alpha-glucoside permease [Vanrija pseudolonga]|uniref:General alpha-glucoside permease n=1 Tax=Vanrija pseudolonga TaxID=143232 RepID=A0AAF0YA33_9TREE|nr:General alpha-glucoside permease [Vanrija pseudolonga]